MAIDFSFLFALLTLCIAFLNVSDSSATVINWLVNLMNSAGFTSWIRVCCNYLCFWKATFAQDVVDNLPYRSTFQPYASYICMASFTVLLLLTGFIIFLDGHWNTSNFITLYIGIVIFLGALSGHKILRDWELPCFILLEEVDLQSRMQDVLHEESPVFRESCLGT